MAKPVIDFEVTLTAKQWAAVRAKMKAQLGVDPSVARSGTLPETHGVVLAYTVETAADASANIAFTVVKRPFFVGMNLIEMKTRQTLEEA